MTQQRTYTDHRKAVLAALRLRKMTRYALAKRLSEKRNVTPNVAYAYLNGHSGISTENLHAINDELGIVYTIKP